jgi:hypothetical protein
VKKTTLILILLLFVASESFAEPPPSFSDAVGRANSFVQAVDRVIRNIFGNTELLGIVDTLWTAMAVMILVGGGIRCAVSDVPITYLIHPLMMVAITRILIDNYNDLTSLCWDFCEGVAGTIQYAGIGTRDLFFLPGFVNDIYASIQTNEISLWKAFWPFISTNIIFALIYGMIAIGFVVNAWALWGYCLSKIIGVFMIPFVMLKRTEFIFDGWVKLFTGFLVYGMIGRVNLLLVVIATKSFFKIPGNLVETRIQHVRWDISSLGDIVGTAAFLLLGLSSLFATGRFAATVVSGAGGLGGAISRAASFTTSAVSMINRVIKKK